MCLRGEACCQLVDDTILLRSGTRRFSESMFYNLFVLLNDERLNSNFNSSWKHISNLPQGATASAAATAANQRVRYTKRSTRGARGGGWMIGQRGVDIFGSPVRPSRISSHGKKRDLARQDCNVESSKNGANLKNIRKQSLQETKGVVVHPLNDRREDVVARYEIESSESADGKRDDGLSTREMNEYDDTCMMQGNLPLPSVNMLNIADLDLNDTWDFEKDLITNDDYEPLYSRIPQSRSRSSTVCRRQPLLAEGKDYELETWPKQENEKKNASKTANNDMDMMMMVVPGTRMRQRTSNANFLRLYATETRCRLNATLPEVHVDDRTLQSLTTHQLGKLTFSPEIKLALLTRKKLWIDMLETPLRLDLFGDGFPWNQDFVPIESRGGGTNDTSSLLGVHDASTMLKPCGRLSLGKRRPPLQYVVKGWCDSRFQQSRASPGRPLEFHKKGGNPQI